MNIEKIRKDFPSLQQKINGKPIIYFDNACVTLRPRQVVEAMNEYYLKYPSCAGRTIHKFGKMVTEKCQEARKTVAKFIGANTEEIVFTKNTTEGINLVAHSFGLKKGDIVLTTDREHNSNLLPWQILSRNIGIRHEIVFSEEDMTFDLETFEKIINRRIKLVSMFYTSNLDGYTIPAKEIVEIAHDHGVLVMLDGAQSVPHKPIDAKKLDVDFLAFSGHKMLGPSGIGVLYGKYHLLEKLNPFLVGGDTVQTSTYTSHTLMNPPEKFEAGLQNYPSAIGLASAVRYVEKIGRKNIERYETKLNKFMSDYLINQEGVKIIGPLSPELRSGIISFNIKGINSHDVAKILDERANIMIRSGQHCVHSWFKAHRIDGSARVSVYLYNTKEEAQVFIENLEALLSWSQKPETEALDLHKVKRIW